MSEPETIMSAPEGPMSAPPQAVHAPDLDLDGYSSRYSGVAKLQRLRLVAERCRNLQRDAYRLLLSEYKGGLDTSSYRETRDEAAKVLPSIALDENWITRTEAAATELQHKLESELTSFRSNLDSKAILRGTLALGDFFVRRGELFQAQRHYLRARDYTSSPGDTIRVYLSVIKVGLWSGEYNLALNYVAKAENSFEAAEAPEAAAKVAVAGALAFLSSGNYHKAAKLFISSVVAFPNDFDDLIAPEDVALYVGVLSLAHFSRGELRDLVVGNNSFQNFVELLPDVNGMVRCFYDSRYLECLETLKRLQPRMELDPYLSRHCESLFTSIRDRCLQQYFSTYVSVKFDRMAAAFGISMEEAEERAAESIADGRLLARIDSDTQALYAATDNSREIPFRDVLKTAGLFLAGSRATLLRMSILQNDMGLRRGVPSGSLRILEPQAAMEMEVETL